jgi:putative addiction module component (TIGR02574 family)
MNKTAQQLLAEALALPATDRAELATELDSLDPQIDGDADALWAQEITNRIASLDSGEVAAIPWSEARRMILGESDGSESD